MTEQSAFPIPTRTWRNQNQQILNRIAAARELILSARADPEISDLMAEYGYGAARLATGLDLHKAARAAFTACQWSISGQKQAATAFEAAETTARQVFADFLAVARFLFKDSHARMSMGLDDRIPEDMYEFIAFARSHYEAASNHPVFRSQLNQYGSLESACASIDEFVVAGMVYQAAGAASLRATKRRDEVIACLDEWVRDFRKAIKTALKDRPDLMNKIRL